VAERRVAAGRARRLTARLSHQLPCADCIGAKNRSFHDAGLALIVPMRDVNSAYRIVPSGTALNFEFENGGDAMCESIAVL
jgi:hypothetical protein